jgi:hypothetical protein
VETQRIILPLLISVLVAIGITYLVIIYLPFIITGIILLIVAVIIFGGVLAVMWIVMQLVLLPYYALKKVKPKEEESRGGYRLGEVKQAKSEMIKTQPESVKPEKSYCPQCGTEVRPDAQFCPHCGAKLR